MLERLAFAPGANIKQNPDGRIVTGSDFGSASTLDTSKEFGEKLLEKARRFLPRIKEAKLETVTLGHRVLPKDDHPIVGFVKSYPNLYVAAMHSGITLSPLDRTAGCRGDSGWNQRRSAEGLPAVTVRVSRPAIQYQCRLLCA